MTQDIEQRARDMGWVPQEEFNGDPANWKSAEDFVRIGENYMPVLRERLGKLEGVITGLRAENRKTTDSLHKLAEWHRGTWKRQYEKAMQEIQAEKLLAVEQGDTGRYRELEEAERAVQADAAKSDPAVANAPAVDEFYEFQERNDWYGKDPEMTMYANGLQPIIVNEGVTDNKTFFQEVEKRIRLRFPDKFKNRAKNLPPSVEIGEGGDTNVGDGKKKWGDLPPEAKSAYMNNFQDIMTKDKYAEEYWLQEGV